MSHSQIDKYLSLVTFTPSVVGYLQNSNQVLLGVRKKVSLGLGQNLIAGIGGKIGDKPENKGETPSEAMDREAEEEIGIKIIKKQSMGRVRFIFTHKDPNSQWNQNVQIFSISKWTGTPIETESTQPAWFNINQIPWNQMWQDNKIWLPKTLSGQPVDAIFLFSDDNKLSDYEFLTG